ncbi:MAG: phage portal protein [Sphingobacteriaceae bacterium]|nr:phage portal protein [Sphingobacteriaceae bacterium]
MNLVRGIKSAFSAFYRGITNNAMTRAVNSWVVNGTIYGQFTCMEEYITDAYQKNADVYSIVSFIASKVALAPFNLYEVKNEKEFRKYKALTTNPTQESLSKAKTLQIKALEEIGGDHPLLTILNTSPNENMDGSEFKYACAVYRLLTGNTYIYGFGPETEDPVKKFIELHILPSQHTSPVSGGEYQPVRGYKLSYRPGEEIPKANVAHYRYFNPDFDNGANPHIIGQSPVQAASNALLASNSGYEAEARAFQNGGMVGVLYEDGNTSMTDTQRIEMQKHIDQKMAGSSNFKQIIAASSKLGWIQIGTSPIDLGILEGRQGNLRTFCNIFHVNSAIFNDPENKTYNNMVEARKAAITDAVLPELTALRDALNKWLVPGWSKADNKRYFLDFDTSVYAELQDDMKALAEWLEKAWWIDPNEKRAQMNYDAKGPAFDECFIPAGIMPISQTVAPDFEKSFDKVGDVDF